MNNQNQKYNLTNSSQRDTELREIDRSDYSSQVYAPYLMKSPFESMNVNPQEIMPTEEIEFDSEESESDLPNRPRTENFEEADPCFIKKIKGATTVLALCVFVTVVIYPPMTLVHVECIEDKLQDGL